MAWNSIDHTYSIAGIFQAVALAQQIARKGQAQEDYFANSLSTLLKVNSNNTEEIFGGRQNIRLGLTTLLDQLSLASDKRDFEITRHFILLTHLERKLMKNPEMVKYIQSHIERVQQQLHHYPLTHTNIIASLADIYVNTISQLRPRILVNGVPAFLASAGNPEKIRALLLAGIRAAVLWRQLGGNRFKLIFYRKKYEQTAIEMLNSLQR